MRLNAFIIRKWDLRMWVFVRVLTPSACIRHYKCIHSLKLQPLPENLFGNGEAGKEALWGTLMGIVCGDSHHTEVVCAVVYLSIRQSDTSFTERLAINVDIKPRLLGAINRRLLIVKLY